MTVEPIAAFSDNYIWCLRDADRAVIVDPGDAGPVLHHCQQQGLSITAILITHHHPDHTGGIATLLSRFPGCPVYGPRTSPCDQLTQRVTEGDTVSVLDCDFNVIAVPGHTLDHIAYWSTDNDTSLLFCGDTLFAAGCGRLFEGSAGQMYHSLAKLAALPDHTQVYCAHEYTLSNLKFAEAVEPANTALQQRILRDRGARERGQPTVPSSLALEKATNPFLRCHLDRIAEAASVHQQSRLTTPEAVFAAVRIWKDNF